MNQTSKDADILIIGGGAAGLMAAIIAAEKGADVILLEKQENIGKKLSATGNGRCNFTNANMHVSCFFAECDFLEPALYAFSEKDAITFFEESGIAVVQKDGYYYPISGQAGQVRDALLFRFIHSPSAMHKCKCSCEVVSAKKENDIFCVKLKDGYEYRAEKLILACGSKAAPQLGGSDYGERLAKAFGHVVKKQLPALCGLKTSVPGWAKAAGVRIQAKLCLYASWEGFLNKKDEDIIKNKKDIKSLPLQELIEKILQWKKNAKLLGDDRGELQITSYGMSGILAFQFSSRVNRCLAEGMKVFAQICFLPEKTQEEILHFFLCQRERYPQKPMLSVLCGLFPEKLAQQLLTYTFGRQKKHRQETVEIGLVTEKMLNMLTQNIHSFFVPVDGSMDFEYAQAACGGVSLAEIDKYTMESKLVSGLFFAGEIMDVDGICGGYNLQWAWSSGYLAGSSAAV